MNATDFYRELFQDTGNSKTDFLGVYEASSSSNVLMYFNYQWTLKNNTVVNFECVDLFELTEEKDKFKRLKIIYDTYSIRKDFEKNKDKPHRFKKRKGSSFKAPRLPLHYSTAKPWERRR